MPRKNPEPETTDTTEIAPDLAADAIVSEPKFYAATDDPSHPLHHHAKRDSLESPPSEE